MLKQIIGFLKDEEGASAVEYGLIAGLIAAVIVGILVTLGGQLNGFFGLISGELETTPSGTTP